MYPARTSKRSDGVIVAVLFELVDEHDEFTRWYLTAAIPATRIWTEDGRDVVWRPSREMKRAAWMTSCAMVDTGYVCDSDEKRQSVCADL